MLRLKPLLKFSIILTVCFTFTYRFLAFSSEIEEEKFYIATKAFSDGFYRASLSLFKKFIEEFPQSKKIYIAKLYMAKCYYFNKNYLRALETFNELLKEKEAADLATEVYYWLGEINFQGKNFKDALAYAKKVIEKKADSKFYWGAYYLSGKSYLALLKEREAEDYFNKIIEECREEDILENTYEQLFNLYLRQNSYFKIISLGEKYHKRYPRGNLKAKVYFYLGKSYYAQKEFDKAIANYKSALEWNEDMRLNDWILQELGFSLISKGDKVRGKKSIDKIKNDELRLFSQGVYYFKIHNYLKSLETFDLFLKKFPKSSFLVNAYINKAEMYYELGRINDAIYLYRHILDSFRGFQYRDVLDKAHYGLAWCYLKKGEFRKAIDEFKNTLKYTDNPTVKISSQIQIADAYQEAEKYSEALDIYNKILKNYPNTIYADYIQFQIGMVFMKMKDLESALFALRNLERKFPSSKLIPETKYYLAAGYFGIEAYQEAEKLLRSFIEEYPQNEFLPKVYYLYGKCFFNEKKYQQALDIFKAVIEKFKDKEIEELVYIDIGNTYLNLSLPEKAKKVWNNFLVRFPSSRYRDSVSLYLGGLYEKEGEYSQAEVLYRKVVEGNPSSPWAQDALFSLGHLHLNTGNLNKAREYLGQLSKEDSSLALKAKLYIAKTYVREHNNREALKIYDELINGSSDTSKVALLEKAYLLKDMKIYSEAIYFFRRAIEEDLDSSKIRFYLGLCLEKTNRDKEAIDEYFKAIYTFDDNEYKVKSYFRIAKIYEKQKNIEGAKEIYKKLMNFNIEEAKIAKARLKELEGR
jgi:tetratricopeptide (TPR) repeat protein